MQKRPFDLFFIIVAVSILFSVFAKDIKGRIDFIMTGVMPAEYPQPYWPPIRIISPGLYLGIAKPVHGDNPVGSDFVQVYLSAKALTLGKSAYNLDAAGLTDPFGRLPNYPPIVNWAYIPFTSIYYPSALLLHNFLTLGIFVILSLLILFQTGNGRDWWKVLIIYALLYFYTPLGYSHYEKGQFDLYSAGAHLLPAVAFMGNAGLVYFVTTGLMGAFKWSSVPFIGAFCAFAFFASGDKKRWWYAIPLVVLALSVLLFWPQFLEYLPNLSHYEINVTQPSGLTFMHFMPKDLAKSFQIINLALFTAAFLWFSNKENRVKLFQTVSLPFALAMAAQGLCFGSISNEYRVVSLLGLVVPFLVWAEKAEAPGWIKWSVGASLGAFLVFVFRNFNYIIHPSDTGMTLVFLIASLFWMGTSFYLIHIQRSGTIPADLQAGSQMAI